MYSKVFKFDQVTYGKPFQIKTPFDDGDADSIKNIPDGKEDLPEAAPAPEELVKQAEQEGKRIIKDAEKKAEILFKNAVEEAKEKVKQLHEEAWQNGYAEGMEAARLQNESIIAETEKIRQIAAREHDSLIAGMEAEMLELVIGTARKAVAGELLTNRDIILQLLRDALPNCSNKNGAVLKVSSSDYEYLSDNKERLESMIEDADLLEIKEDKMLKSGDCIVETPLGSVDSGVGTRLDKIADAFREEL